VQVTGQAGAVGAGALDTHPIEPTSRLYPGQQLRVAVRRSRRHGGTRCAYRLRRRSFVYCSASYSSFPVLVSIADRSEQASDGTCAVPAAHVPNQRFVDPGGFTVELACSKGLLPQVNNGVKFEKFLHTAWGGPGLGPDNGVLPARAWLQSVGLDRQSRWILPISGSLSSLLGTDAQ
jgi:hypothetical protein